MHCLLSLRGISSCRQRAKIEIFEHLQGQQVQKTTVFMNRSFQHMILHQNIELRNHVFTLFREVLGPMVTFPNLWRNGWKPSIIRWPIDHIEEELCFILPADISSYGKYGEKSALGNHISLIKYSVFLKGFLIATNPGLDSKLFWSLKLMKAFWQSSFWPSCLMCCCCKDQRQRRIYLWNNK